MDLQTMAGMLRCLSFLTIVSLCCRSSPTCDHSLVTGPYGVPNAAITASSFHPHCPTHLARITSDNSWCPYTVGNGEYLQVKFQYASIIKAVITGGRQIYAEWVSSYKVNISMDGLTWRYLLDSTGEVQVFTGNSDQNTVVINELKKTVIAQYIRVIAVSGSRRRSMRLEVTGCPMTCSPCNYWEAKLGSSGDVLPFLMEADSPNQGLCGLKCSRQVECESFLFDVTSTRCLLFKGTDNGAQATVNLDGVWYFVKTNL